MTTTERNELIADFIGLSKQDKSNGGKFYLYESPITGEYIEPEDLLYDDSWNWLMPVVEKINNLHHHGDIGYDVRIEAANCMVLNFDGDIITQYEGQYVMGGALIDYVYPTIIQFIQWYNEQPDK